MEERAGPSAASVNTTRGPTSYNTPHGNFVGNSNNSPRNFGNQPAKYAGNFGNSRTFVRNAAGVKNNNQNSPGKKAGNNVVGFPRNVAGPPRNVAGNPGKANDGNVDNLQWRQRPRFDGLPGCRVLVTGFPSFTQAGDLARTFSKFGAVMVERMNQKLSYAYLVYSNEDEAKAAIQAHRSVIVYGEILQVKLCSSRPDPNQPPKRDFTRSKQKDVIINPEKIDLSGDFHSQLGAVLAAVRLTQEEATVLGTLYEDVERVLQDQWPGCVAMPFGSITTGLGIKSSDADCFVSIPRGAGQGNSQVPRAARVLAAWPALFAEILAIPRANTPIVKFFHVPTATNCDLSFKTPLGARNSKLVALLLHRDPRLLPAAVFIKYWAKVHGLTGTGKLTNYALTMMILFFLQQRPRCILPAVAWLQRDRSTEVMVDYWNTGFLDDPRVLPPYDDGFSVSELIGEFFEYYTKFNFEDLVVCPFLGVPIDKEAFRSFDRLPNEYAIYKANVYNNLVMPLRFTTPMCVQDPFEQSHNVASSVSGKLAFDIKAYFHLASSSYEKEKRINCKEFLKFILLQKPKVIKGKGLPEYKITLFPRIMQTIVTPDWKAAVREVVLKIFEKLLKTKLGKLEEKQNPEAKKTREKYIGTMTRAVWKRKNFTRLYSVMDLGFEEMQTRITEEILNVDQHVLNMKFQLMIMYAKNPNSGAICMRLLSGDPVPFIEFGKFFLSNVQGWFLELLKPYTEGSAATTIDPKVQVAETIKLLDSNMDTGNDLDSDDDADDDGLRRNLDDKETSDDDSTGPEDGDDANVAKVATNGPQNDNGSYEKLPANSSNKAKLSTQDTDSKEKLRAVSGGGRKLAEESGSGVILPAVSAKEVKLPAETGSEVKLPTNTDSKEKLPADMGNEELLSAVFASKGKLSIESGSEVKPPTHTGSKEKLSTDIGSEEILPAVSGKVKLPENSDSEVKLPENTVGEVQLCTDTGSKEKLPTDIDSEEIFPAVSGSEGKLPTDIVSKVKLPHETGSEVKLPAESGSSEVKLTAESGSSEVKLTAESGGSEVKLPAVSASEEILPTDSGTEQKLPADTNVSKDASNKELDTH